MGDGYDDPAGLLCYDGMYFTQQGDTEFGWWLSGTNKILPCNTKCCFRFSWSRSGCFCFRLYHIGCLIFHVPLS